MAKATQPATPKVVRTAGSQTVPVECECAAAKTMRSQQQSLQELGATMASLKKQNKQIELDLQSTRESLASAVDSLFTLQRSSCKALSAFHKHRFKWCAGITDTTRGLDSSDYSPSGVLCVVDAASNHREAIERFHKWVLSDEQGGSCFLACCAAQLTHEFRTRLGPLETTVRVCEVADSSKPPRRLHLS